jgi:hypothetical protein
LPCTLPCPYGWEPALARSKRWRASSMIF